MFQDNHQHSNPASNWLLAAGIICVLIKLWLVGGHELLAKFRPHDDSLFAFLAMNLLEGNWLGDYNNKTLIKGVGYPLFMAISVWLGVPLLALQHTLYAFVCGLTILALKPAVRNPVYLLLGFLFLLFNPLTYSYPLMSVTLRASLYLSLALWVFASLIALWNYRRTNSWINFSWSISLAVSFSWFWITREESVWIVPAIICYVLVYLIPWKWHQGSQLILRISTLTIPVLIFLATQFTVMMLNQSYYGVATTNELKSDEFTSALGGLMRIKQDKFENYVVVSADAQAKAFEVSPTFSALAPYLSTESKKVINSFYIWKLRSAVRKAGYYDNPNDATREFDFYRKMGIEINTACDNGIVDCHQRAPSIRPIWHSQFNGEVLPVFWELTTSALTFSLFNPISQGVHSKEDLDTLFNFDILTGENTLRKSEYFDDKLPGYYRRIVYIKERLMAALGVVYKYLTPLLFVCVLAFHLYLLVEMATRRRFSSKPVIGLILLGSIFTLLAMLTFVKITIWPVFRPMHTLSPILLLYVVYMLLPRRQYD